MNDTTQLMSWILNDRKKKNQKQFTIWNFRIFLSNNSINFDIILLTENSFKSRLLYYVWSVHSFTTAEDVTKSNWTSISLKLDSTNIRGYTNRYLFFSVWNRYSIKGKKKTIFSLAHVSPQAYRNELTMEIDNRLKIESQIHST